MAKAARLCTAGAHAHPAPANAEVAITVRNVPTPYIPPYTYKTLSHTYLSGRRLQCGDFLRPMPLPKGLEILTMLMQQLAVGAP